MLTMSWMLGANALRKFIHLEKVDASGIFYGEDFVSFLFICEKGSMSGRWAFLNPTFSIHMHIYKYSFQGNIKELNFYAQFFVRF